MDTKFKKLELSFLAWYGWTNKNTCLFEAWIPHCHIFNLGNCGLTILPLHFWEEVGISYRRDWSRFYFGCGLFYFFISFKTWARNSKNQRQLK